MSPAEMFSPITTTSTEAEPPLQKSLFPTQQLISKSPGMKSSMVPSQQLQPASTFSSSSSLVECPQTACDFTKKLNPPFKTADSKYEWSVMGLTNFPSSADEPAQLALKNSATVAGENMPSTTYSSGVFSNISPLLNGSSMRSAVQAIASPFLYNSPYNHLTAPAILSPDSFVDLGSIVAPGIPLRREHAASREIQQQLINIRNNGIRRGSQNTSTVPSGLIQIPGLHRDSQKVSVDYTGQGSHSGHTAMPLQSLPVRINVNPEYLVHYGREPSDVRQTGPRPNTEPERTSTTTSTINPQSHQSLNAFASPAYNTHVSSTSVSPQGCFSCSPQQTLGTPASSELYNTSKSNTPTSMIGEQTRRLSTGNTSQNNITPPSSNPKKRKLSHGEGLQKGCEPSTVIPIDVKSASRSEGKRRKHEREASARYRQKKKFEKSAEPSEEANKSVALSTTSSNSKECGTSGSMKLAPPTSTEMALSSSQQSFSSNLSGSTQVSTSSGPNQMVNKGTNCDEWPDLPELHPYERRPKINYRPLAPYGSPETIQTYPRSFQASLHRVMDFQKITHLRTISHRVLFVYGSLMISDLWHDVFEHPAEWIFHNEIVKKCMCPAKVPGYSRFAVHGSDEPLMMKAEKSASVCVHGMLIFGLGEGDFGVLDRYRAQGFVREQVNAYVHLKASSINFEVEAYVWPREETTVMGGEGRGRGRGSGSGRGGIDRGLEWTVERFWDESRLGRIYREAVVEHKLLREQAAIRKSMPMLA